MFCFGEKSPKSMLIQQNEKSTEIYSKKLWIRSLASTVTVGKVHHQDCNYINHRRFTLRCISKGIVLATVRLRSSNTKISKGAKETI